MIELQLAVGKRGNWYRETSM